MTFNQELSNWTLNPDLDSFLILKPTLKKLSVFAKELQFLSINEYIDNRF